MSQIFASLEEETAPEAGMTPLIDVVFQLLVFFMLTSTFATPSLELSLPQLESDAAPATPEAWNVEIDASGQIAVEGEITNDLAGTLQGLITEEPGRDAIALRADRATDHGDVLSLMQALGELGLRQIYFVYESNPDPTEL